MKRTKKLLALVLAMVMAFSLMAVTAAAAGTEEHEHVCSAETIQPRKPWATCSYCGEAMTETQNGTDNEGRYIIFVCYNDTCSYFLRDHVRATQTIHW